MTGKVDVVKGDDGTLSEAEAKAEEGEKKKGVPEFWVRALMNHGGVQETIAEEDIPALEYLADVRCVDKEDYTVRFWGMMIWRMQRSRGVGGWAGLVDRATSRSLTHANEESYDRPPLLSSLL